MSIYDFKNKLGKTNMPSSIGEQDSIFNQFECIIFKLLNAWKLKIINKSKIYVLSKSKKLLIAKKSYYKWLLC